MARINETLDRKIIEAAKVVFKEKGYKTTTLIEIAKEANVATGAIYRRYHSKEELFSDVINPVVKITDSVIDKYYKQSMMKIEQQDYNIDFRKELSIYWVEKMYEYEDEAKILFSKSDYSKYSNYINFHMDKVVKVSSEIFEAIKEKAGVDFGIEMKEYRILFTSYWQACFNIMKCDFTKEEAINFVDKLVKVFDWSKVFYFDTENNHWTF